MRRFTVELSESELKVIANALRYAKSYKGIEVYETVLTRVVAQLRAGTPKYYVVQGTLDDGIFKSTESVLVKAKNKKHAVQVAAAYLVTDAGVTFIPKYVEEATKSYEVARA